MDFEPSARAVEYRNRLQDFVTAVVEPATPVYAAQVEESGDPHFHPPVMEDLKVEARHDPDQTSLCMRETLYRYYNLRNRFLYVKKHYEPQKIKYFAFWTMAGALMLARALLGGKMAKARALVLAIMHAYAGRYGNQNAMFT